MDEDEILDQEPIPTDSRGIYSNKAADTLANNGFRGKLNEQQLDERAVLHAKRMVTGIPTIKTIVEHWYNEYGITMTPRSEREWADNNQKRIDAAAATLEEGGEMPVVVVPPGMIASMLGRAGRDMVEAIKTNKKAQSAISDQLVDFTNPYQQIGAQNKETYWVSDGEQRKEFDRRLDHAIKLNKANVTTYKALTDATVEQGKVLVSMLELISDINEKGQLLDKTIEKKLADRIKSLGLKHQQKRDAEAFDPLEPVTDDERIN